MTKILKFEPQKSEKIINNAATIVLKGGIIAYPTETFYGLGADATNEQAIHRIFEIKGRNFNNPISVIIAGRTDVYSLIKDSSDTAEKIMDVFWPGPLTIVFRAQEKVLPLLTAKSGNIGIRFSDHEIARFITQKAGCPLTATSANLSGKPEYSKSDDVIKEMGDKIDAIVDAGTTPGGKVSTVIDVTCDPPIILREGAISKKSIENIL